jgi:hypothetical protein
MFKEMKFYDSFIKVITYQDEEMHIRASSVISVTKLVTDIPLEFREGFEEWAVVEYGNGNKISVKHPVEDVLNAVLNIGSK